MSLVYDNSKNNYSVFELFVIFRINCFFCDMGKIKTFNEFVNNNMKIDHRQTAIYEMAVPLKSYKSRVDGLRFELVKNWCLCKWCQLYNPECENFNHWIDELSARINNLKFLDIKNGIDKRKTLIRKLIDEYDYNETNMIDRIIHDKFDTEKITDDNQRVKVAAEFADNIQGLIDVISINSMSLKSYIQTTFEHEYID